MSSGALERKMCNSSVEPTPSRMSTPKRAFQALPTDSGKGSPAEEQRRSRDPAFALFAAASFNMAENSVGAPKNRVGLYLFNSSYIRPGVGRSAFSTELAPTAIGNVKALPSP